LELVKLGESLFWKRVLGLEQGMVVDKEWVRLVGDERDGGSGRVGGRWG
jgi:hypothetical protein